MPYNRWIGSAGTVVRFGDSSNENHALDLCTLPGNRFLAIEHRFGIVIMDPLSHQIIAGWQYKMDRSLRGMMSTYSGITSLHYGGKDYIFWGAAEKKHSAIMSAIWDGQTISAVTTIDIPALKAGEMPLPNQVIARIEDGIPYLYTALNGVNRVCKIRLDQQSITWQTPVGAAPYGVCLIDNQLFVTNWAGPEATDSSRESAGIPWGKVYTDPVTGATSEGSLSVLDARDGKWEKNIALGLHPNAVIASPDQQYLYITNSNSDEISVVHVAALKNIGSIPTGILGGPMGYSGSSPNALCLNEVGSVLYVANGMDNAIQVIQLGKDFSATGKGNTRTTGYIPTEAYPSGLQLIGNTLYVTNLEATGSGVLTATKEFRKEDGSPEEAYTIHQQLASVSCIPLPGDKQLLKYTREVRAKNVAEKMTASRLTPRAGVAAKPVPERIGEPSVFKHVIYIIKENKTYDQVFGDIKTANGNARLCIYGNTVTPNQHALADRFTLMDQYYASGKSSAEGHQWSDAAMVSDYVEKSVRAWFRSYPHRQEDALVYNRSGFIWNQALDHQRSVRIYGEACTTHYPSSWGWADIYRQYRQGTDMHQYNTTTIARIRPIISPDYPDCDNFKFTDQLRADILIRDLKHYESLPGDSLPNLLVVSLPVEHTSGTAPNFPVPQAMVADNDYALGRIVEAFTHSRFWDSTVIFVTEDDSQSGWDHVSPYRTIGQVISPYSMHAKPVHTRYNQTSMVRTIEQILGLPPMNVMDATAQPMFDCFTEKPVRFTYTALPGNIPFDQMNKPLSALQGKSLYYAKLSKTKAFTELDSGEDDSMNRILWFDAKGEEAYPAAVGGKDKK